jgi:hypothetical protein
VREKEDALKKLLTVEKEGLLCYFIKEEKLFK